MRVIRRPETPLWRHFASESRAAKSLARQIVSKRRALNRQPPENESRRRLATRAPPSLSSQRSPQYRVCSPTAPTRLAAPAVELQLGVASPEPSSAACLRMASWPSRTNDSRLQHAAQAKRKCISRGFLHACMRADVRVAGGPGPAWIGAGERLPHPLRVAISFCLANPYNSSRCGSAHTYPPMIASRGIPQIAASTAAKPATPQIPSGARTPTIACVHLARRCFNRLAWSISDSTGLSWNAGQNLGSRSL